MRFYSCRKNKISQGVEVSANPLAAGPFNIAVLVRDAAHMVKRGLEQRDTAIKAGASGATTLIFSDNKFTMPSMEDEDAIKDILSINSLLVSRFNPKQNDVIIIGSAGNRRLAEFGANATAFELLKSTSEIA